MGIPVGYLVDMYGTRPVVAPFAALGITSLGLLSLCTKYYQLLLAQGFAFGLACGGTTLPAIMCEYPSPTHALLAIINIKAYTNVLFLAGLEGVTQWFTTKRGLAVGLASTGSSFGGVIYPIMVSRLINQHGFSTAVKWCTLTVGIGMLFGVLLADSPFPGRKKRDQAAKQRANDLEHDSSGAAGEPDKERPTSEDPKDFQGQGVWAQIKQALSTNGAAWGIFAAAAFFCTFAALTPLNYLPEFAEAAGMSVEMSQYTLVIINAGQSRLIAVSLFRFNADFAQQYLVEQSLLQFPTTLDSSIYSFWSVRFRA